MVWPITTSATSPTRTRFPRSSPRIPLPYAPRPGGRPCPAPATDLVLPARRIGTAPPFEPKHGPKRRGLRTILPCAVGLVLGLAVVSAPLAAQDPQQRIQAVRAAAELRGLPVALIDLKVAEGRAKGVPIVRIAAAVERRLELLAQARAIMTQAPRTGPVTVNDLSAGADAIEAGVGPEVLGRMTTSVPVQQRAVAIAVLASLVSHGESSDEAFARVMAAVQRGPEALRLLPTEAVSYGDRQ